MGFILGTGEPSKGRIAAFDIAKGVAIILVVYGHCLRGLIAGNAIEPQAPLFFSDYAIYTFHMPLFFVISGYFLDRSGKRDFGSVWRARIRTIAYPYFLWSLVHGGLLYAVSGSGLANNDMPFSRLLEIGWNPISPYWFLYALFFAFALAALLQKLPFEWMVALALSGFLGLFTAGPSVFLDIAYAFLYFSFGMLVRERGLMARLPSSPAGIVLLWLSFAAATAASYLLGIPERLPLASALIGLAAVFSTCLFLERRYSGAAVVRMLELLGQCSMGIFVLHIIVLAAIRLVLLRMLHVTEPSVLLAAGTIAGLLLPTVIQIVAVRMGLQNLLGLPSSAMAGVRPEAIVRQAEAVSRDNKRPARPGL